MANILSLRGQFNIHEDKAVVTADDLLTAVTNYLLDANVVCPPLYLFILHSLILTLIYLLTFTLFLQTRNAEMQNNYERNVADVIQMLPNTLIGIDVNLKFDR